MEKILVVNEGYSSNLGDQAIKESVLNVIQHLGYKADFANYSVPALSDVMESAIDGLRADDLTRETVLPRKKFLQTPRKAAGQLKWYLTNRREIRRILKNDEYSIIIIGGGQLINSSEKVRFNIFSLALYCWVTQAKKNTKARIYLMGVGVVDNFHPVESFFYNQALKLVDGIWVRDKYSSEALKKNFKINSKLMPDFAFYEPGKMEVKYEKSNVALVGVYSFHEISVKLNKDGITREIYYKDWIEVIRRYQQQGFEVKLFYTTFSDAKECVIFHEYLQNVHRLTIEIVQTGTLDKLCELYKKVKKIYSARMHALILGMKYQCEVEAYLVNKKLETFDKEYIKAGKTPGAYSNEVRSVMAEVLGND